MPLREALLLVARIQVICLAGRVGASLLGSSAPLVMAFAAAALLALRPLRVRGGVRIGRCVGVSALGFAGGFALLDVWARAAWEIGWLLRLPPPASDAALAPYAGAPVLWVAGVLVAPCFEELVYRRHLLRALRRRLASAWAVGAASLAFAVPHGDPWSILAAFLAGLLLGALALLSEGTSLPMGVHAGLNAGVVVRGLPPAPWLAAPAAAAAFAGLALAAGVAVSRRHPARFSARTP